MQEPWRIELFGGLRAKHGGTEITRFATSRVAALLARLVLFPKHPHPREELADLLWPDADPEAGRLSLRVALAALRKQLETPAVPPGSVLDADREAVRLRPQTCRTDVADFEAALREAARAPEAAQKRGALDQALALYAGELLPGFYDEWILEERERLEALYQDACDQRRALPAPAREEEKAPAEKAAPQAPRGFPAQFTRIFGREAECARLTHWLSDAQTRLVTLTGPGGAGKTRLAGEAAQSAAGGFGGPVCFVPLADLPDAHFLPGAVGLALGLPPSPTQEPLEQVVAALASGPPALLVLDNFEHLAERGAPAVLSLLTRLPTLTCLVTSRRRLGLPGERQFPVSPLELPEPEWDADRIGETASARLFVDRAQAARPGFRLTSANAGDVAALCRRLEGLPLAIELVAARAQALTPAQMNERLAHRFELLTSRKGDKNGRHRSLWAAIAWSYDLLPPDLRRFFVRLSVFRGGCTPEAAAAVCGEPEALERLTQLRERSLVIAEEAGTGMRFRLLESLREFGEESVPGGERQALARSHADYFETLTGQMNTFRVGPEKGRVLAMLDADGDNLRAALAFCRTDPPDEGWDGVGVGLRMTGALGDYWTARGMLREGLGWLEGALEGGGEGAVRAKASAEAGWVAAGLGEYDRAEAALSEAVEIGRGLEDRSLLAYALRLRGVAALWREDNARATVDLEEGLALCRALGDDAGTASALNNLGVLARQWRGDNAGAQVLYEEAMTFFRRCGDVQRTSYGLYNLGSIARDLGEYDRAERLLREGLALTDELGDFWQRAYCLRTLGDVALSRGDLAGARLLLEEGRDLSRRLGGPDDGGRHPGLARLGSASPGRSDAGRIGVPGVAGTVPGRW